MCRLRATCAWIRRCTPHCEALKPGKAMGAARLSAPRYCGCTHFLDPPPAANHAPSTAPREPIAHRAAMCVAAIARPRTQAALRASLAVARKLSDSPRQLSNSLSARRASEHCDPSP